MHPALWFYGMCATRTALFAASVPRHMQDIQARPALWVYGIVRSMNVAFLKIDILKLDF
ncbi:MAG: hypothetical protein K2N58_05895 [Treponemataceae bacterium]|nr:hypothetical protein [Treponemataceae bacterium]